METGPQVNSRQIITLCGSVVINVIIPVHEIFVQEICMILAKLIKKQFLKEIFIFFASEKYLCIFHGQVFVMYIVKQIIQTSTKNT